MAEAAADGRRGPPPAAQRAFRVPMESVPDLLMVWEFTQVGWGCLGWPTHLEVVVGPGSCES